MLLIPFILLYQTFLSQGTILNCDFETKCDDFALYGYWPITDGYHPQPIDRDHKLNIKAGHYVFYNPSPSTRGGSKLELRIGYNLPLIDRYVFECGIILLR